MIVWFVSVIALTVLGVVDFVIADYIGTDSGVVAGLVAWAAAGYVAVFYLVPSL